MSGLIFWKQVFATNKLFFSGHAALQSDSLLRYLFIKKIRRYLLCRSFLFVTLGLSFPPLACLFDLIGSNKLLISVFQDAHKHCKTSFKNDRLAWCLATRIKIWEEQAILLWTYLVIWRTSNIRLKEFYI